MHYKTVKGILSKRNSMNIYRGCTHGCIYCDSRSDCYNMDHDFEDIEVKENAIELLEQKLKTKKKKVMIGTGSMSDPYMPLEKTLSMTRKALEVIHRFGFGATVLTKSDLVLRDLSLYKQINQKAKAIVQMTLTTYDEDLCKVLEPHVSTTYARFQALKILSDHQIDTVVWLDPFLPFINDTFDNVEGLMKYCIEAKVKGIICFGIGLTLRAGNRAFFYQHLDQYFPGLKEKYIQTYGLRYEIKSKHHDGLMAYIKQVCEAHNIMFDLDEVFAYLARFPSKDEQLKLFD
ncbi:MAG: radical SAM protein [Acholeplasmatales bacterium]|nr:MAG: radical SAM protein [Acholeplasmatales bacterium]